MLSDGKSQKLSKLLKVLLFLTIVNVLLIFGIHIYNSYLVKSPSTVSIYNNSIYTKDSSSELGLSKLGLSKKTHIYKVNSPSFNGSFSSTNKVDGGNILLFKQRESDSVAFYVENMFPGDVVEKDYHVKVYHNKPIILYSNIKINEGYDKLTEVLKCKVELSGELLYNGLMKECPEYFETKIIPSENKESITSYKITVYLDTSVGNEYQNQELVSTFKWWVEEGNSLIKPPKTGDDTNITEYAVVSVIAVGVLLSLALILWKRRRS